MEIENITGKSGKKPGKKSGKKSSGKVKSAGLTRSTKARALCGTSGKGGNGGKQCSKCSGSNGGDELIGVTKDVVKTGVAVIGAATLLGAFGGAMQGLNN